MQLRDEHLSEDLIWAAIKKKQPLGDSQIDHTGICRDCRDLVHEVTGDALKRGLSFPDLFSKAG